MDGHAPVTVHSLLQVQQKIRWVNLGVCVCVCVCVCMCVCARARACELEVSKIEQMFKQDILYIIFTMDCCPLWDCFMCHQS